MAQPRFFYDLASPEAYLAAERVQHVLGVVPEWVPIRMGVAFRCAEEVASHREDVERAAAQMRSIGDWAEPIVFRIEHGFDSGD